MANFLKKLQSDSAKVIPVSWRSFYKVFNSSQKQLVSKSSLCLNLITSIVVGFWDQLFTASIYQIDKTLTTPIWDEQLKFGKRLEIV